MNKAIVLVWIALLGLFSPLSAQRKGQCPDWVKGFPSSDDYFVGVACVKKPRKANILEIRKRALSEALAEMCSQIEVKVETQSALSILEIDGDVRQQYVKNLKINTNQTIEGYEIADSWEDKENYYVYCRLPKQTFLEKKANAKRNAMKLAESHWMMAETAAQQNRLYEAFKHAANVMTALADFLNEETCTEIDGTSVNLVAEAYTMMNDILNSIHFSANDFTMKKGVSNQQQPKVALSDGNGNPCPQMPVNIEFSGAGLVSSSGVTDDHGMTAIRFQKISSYRDSETLKLSIDVNKLSRLSDNDLVRELIRKMPAASSNFIITLVKPTLLIDATELNDFFRHSTLSQSFDIVNENADYKLNVSITEPEKRHSDGVVEIVLECLSVVTDDNNKQKFSKNLSVHADGNSFDSAREKAMNELKHKFESNIIQMMLRDALK